MYWSWELAHEFLHFHEEGKTYHGNNHGSGTDTETDDETTDGHLGQGEGSGLENCTEDEENATDVDGHFAPILVSGQTGEDGTEEGSARGDGGNERLLADGEIVVVEGCANVYKDSGDDTGVVAEEETAKGSGDGDEPSVEAGLCVFGAVEVLEFEGLEVLYVEGLGLAVDLETLTKTHCRQ